MGIPEKTEYFRRLKEASVNITPALVQHYKEIREKVRNSLPPEERGRLSRARLDWPEEELKTMEENEAIFRRASENFYKAFQGKFPEASKISLEDYSEALWLEYGRELSILNRSTNKITTK